MREVTVSRIDLDKHAVERRKDSVAKETPLHVFVNKTHYVTILCLPTQMRELAVGYLLSEGVVKSLDEVHEVRLDRTGKCLIRLKPQIDAEKRIDMAQPFTRLVLSACGSPDYWPLTKLVDRLDLTKLPSGFKVRAETISEGARRLNTLAEIFRKTGGVHVAALYNANGELLAYAEDVGRHNAVDKVIGTVAIKKLGFSSCFLASSGRLTGDIILKAARVGIPILASLSAALDSGVETAKLTGITLVGFVRGARMSVFAHPERIIVEAKS